MWAAHRDYRLSWWATWLKEEARHEEGDRGGGEQVRPDHRVGRRARGDAVPGSLSPGPAWSDPGRGGT